MSHVESSPSIEADILARSHKILDALGDETVFSNYGEFRLHASAFLVATLQLLLKTKFSNVNRSPITFNDHCFNAKVFLDAVEHYLQIKLKDVTPESICNGDYQAIQKCLEVIEALEITPIEPETDLNSLEELPREEAPGKNVALLTWNKHMATLKLPTLSNWEELQQNASSILTLIVEATVQKRLKGIVRRPLLKRDYLVNARLALKALSNFIGARMDRELASKIVAGESEALDLVSKFITLALNYRIKTTPELKLRHDIDDDGEKTHKLSEDPELVAESRKHSHHLLLNERQNVLLKQLNAMNVKRQAEDELRNQQILKSATRERRYEQIWKSKIEQGLVRDEATLRKIRDETLQYQIGKIFKQALKLERDYQRVQYVAFKDRRKHLEQQWLNRKASIERFFSDKYEMLLSEIQNENARRRSYEIQSRVAFRKMEKELRMEREKRLQLLKAQLLEKDRNMNYLEGEKILNWLFKVPVT